MSSTILVKIGLHSDQTDHCGDQQPLKKTGRLRKA